MFPKSYKLKWRLLNALIKFLEILEKDCQNQKVNTLGIDLRNEISSAKDVSRKWSFKKNRIEFPGLDQAWEQGHEALNNELQRLLDNVIICLGDVIREDCAQEIILAYEYIVKQYCDVTFGIKNDLQSVSDKELIKALNTLRAKKDSPF